MAREYENLSKQIIELVGGKENISGLTHCVSRLRFTLHDHAKADTEAIKKLEGVVGCNDTGAQFQVIIGLHVKAVYQEVSSQLGGDAPKADVPAQKKKFSIGGVLNGALTALVASVVPVLPVVVVYGLSQLLILILSGTGLMPEGSGAYQIITLVANGALYFLPVFVAFSASKHFGANTVLSLLLATALVSPTFIEMVSGGAPIDFFGIPVAAVDYTNTIVPVILLVWILNYVEKLFKRLIPKSLNLLLVPFLTVVVMIPLTFCLLAPLGYYLGTAITGVLYWLHDVMGPIGTAVLAAVYNPLILTGMHHTVGIMGLAAYTEYGYETFVYVATSATIFSTLGTIVAFLIRSKKKENKQLGKSTLFMNGILGLSEPTIYGILVPYKTAFLAQMLGAFAGGLYLGITGVKSYMVAAAGILCLTNFVTGDTANMIQALIGLVIAFAVSFGALMILGVKENAGETKLENPLDKYL